MNNESATAAHRTRAALREGSGAHPAGDVQLVSGTTVGRRARLLAGLDTLDCDASTLVGTSFSMSWGWAPPSRNAHLRITPARRPAATLARVRRRHSLAAC